MKIYGAASILGGVGLLVLAARERARASRGVYPKMAKVGSPAFQAQLNVVLCAICGVLTVALGFAVVLAGR